MTVKDFFKTLGGAARISRDLGIPYTTVAQWQQQNKIPSWRIGSVVALAVKEGQAVPAEIQHGAAA